MDTQSLTWKVIGMTGEGIDSSGEILVSVVRRLKYYANTFRTFPAIIKGGSSAFEVRISSSPVSCRSDCVDLVFVLAADHHSSDWDPSEISKHGLVLFDQGCKPVLKEDNHLELHQIPMTELAQEAGSRLAKNMVVLGVTCNLTGIPLEAVIDEVKAVFATKSPGIVASNIKALQIGFDHASSLVISQQVKITLPPITVANGSSNSTMLITGNEAVSLGALFAGCRFFAGYPITPATPILEWMAEKLPKYGGHVVQTEDEIAALCMVIGANYAGIRGMTATSGPGISLMTESFGLAGMTETPAVIVNVQRPGPSAGQPTKHEQGDILHVVYAGHGDIPRIVLTPGSIQDCFHDSWMAFNLADRFQCPVFILYDQDLALRKQTIDPLPLEDVTIDRGYLMDEVTLNIHTSQGKRFERYQNTDNGISPRVFPGIKDGVHVVSGDEHRFDGTIDVLDRPTREMIHDKRIRKLEEVHRYFEGCAVFGDLNAKIAVIGIGSVTGAAIEALNEIRGKTGISAKFIQLRILKPFPLDVFQKSIGSADLCIVIDQNISGQLLAIIRSQGVPIQNLKGIRKYDGEPYRPRDIARLVAIELDKNGLMQSV